MRDIKIFSGRASIELAKQICNSYGCELAKCSIEKFNDGEFKPKYDESIRGKCVFIIQSTQQPTENLMELLLMVDAAKRASAHKIIAVIPYYGWSRQDRKDEARCSIGSKLVANLLVTAGVDRIITMDLHTAAIQSFFDIPVDHLHSSHVIVPFLKSLKLENLVIASPDTGGTTRSDKFAKFLNSELVICYKSRPRAGEIGHMKVIGDVENKNVILIDDMIDTAGTITAAANLIKKMGAKSVRAVATHAVLSGKALENIDKSSIDEVILTDTIPLKSTFYKIKIISVADMFANVIRNVHTHQSICENFL